MGYRPNLGFTPETLETLIERLRISAQDKLGYSSNSNQEFMASNIWLVYYAVALMKNQTDLLFEELLDKVFDYFLETYGSLKQNEGSSGNGLNQILQNHSQGFEVQTFQNNPELNLGEIRISLLEPDLTNLSLKLADYFDFTINTKNQDSATQEKIRCDIGFGVEFYYTPAQPTPLYLAISYQFIAGYVPTGKEKQEIKELFLKKWEEFQILGRDFLPDAYLGNCTQLPYLASLSVGCKLAPEENYSFEPRIHQFGEYFTIQTSEDGEPLIEMLEREA